MTGRFWVAFAMLAAAVLAGGPVVAQAPKPESMDEVSEDNDILQQLGGYTFTVEQLKAMVPILQQVDTKRQALEAYQHSEEALGPLRALRAALVKGAPTDQLQPAADAVWDKSQKLEAEVDEAVPAATKQIAALLTEEQLATAAAGADQADTIADQVFNDLDSSRGLDDAAFTQWQNQKAHDYALQAAGDDNQRVPTIEAGLKQFFAKVRKLDDAAYGAQSDALLQELQKLVGPTTKPKADRKAMEQTAAEQLELFLRSARALPLIQQVIQARG